MTRPHKFKLRNGFSAACRTAVQLWGLPALAARLVEAVAQGRFYIYTADLAGVIARSQ